MVSISLQQVCGKYVNSIRRLESRDCDTGWSDLISMETERIKWHNAVMDALNAEGIPYTDRGDASDIAYNIALGRYS